MGKKNSGPVKRKRKAKQDAPREAILLIPLTYNDKTRIPKATLDGIRDELFVAFEGWTTEGEVRGAYKMKSGKKRVEWSVKLSVVLMESQIPELEAMVGKWCAELEQETMLLKISDYTIKFVPPLKEGE